MSLMVHVRTSEGGALSSLRLSVESSAGHGHLNCHSLNPSAYALRIKGMGLFPAMRAAWIVAVDLEQREAHGDCVLIMLKSGEHLIQELLFWQDETLVLNHVNGNPRITFQAHDVVSMETTTAVVPPRAWRSTQVQAAVTS